MTELQMKLVEFYKNYHKEHKTHPDLKVVAEYFGVSYQTIAERAETLVNKGYLTKVRRGAFIPTRRKI
jgi:predicted transcriptional regulator